MSAETGFDPGTLRGSRRLLVVADFGGGADAFREQEQTLATDPRGMADRDLSVLRLTGVGASLDDRPLGIAAAETARLHYAVPPHGFTVVLVGKDGEVKLRRTSPVPTTVLYGLIDAMPMRRREVAERARP